MKRLVVFLCLLLVWDQHILEASGADANTDGNSRLWAGLAKLVVETLKLIEPKRAGRIGGEASPRGGLLESVLPQDCGKLYPTQRLSAGREAKPGEHPSYVRIDITQRLANGSLRTDICGGTLIGSRYVLTAAHCFKPGVKYENIYAVTTIWNKHTGPGQLDNLKYKVTKRCLSSEYKFNTEWRNTHHDVALLQLNDPINFNRLVQPACLPSTANSVKGGPLQVVGLGYTNWKLETNTYERPAQKLRLLPVQAASSCRDPRDSHLTKVCMDSADPRMVGTTCEGDDGGPVYATENGRHVVVGLVSYGYSPCWNLEGQQAQFVASNVFTLRDELERLLAECKV